MDELGYAKIEIMILPSVFISSQVQQAGWLKHKAAHSNAGHSRRQIIENI